MEGIWKVKTAGPGIRIGIEVNTIGLHFVLFVVGLPQFGGGQSFSFGRGIASPFVPPLPLAGYGPVVWYSGRMSVFPCPALDLQLMGDVMWINCPL